ncbi:hypothetical protein E0H80_06875 [Acinetobacter sp. ANC 4779]|uniref:hypothetical protein n=1 Tax=Acinetobacter sp. ANC 4779 TaxID=2529848 RepID=UPI00103A1277|nr:hypothetical protein [Acinetobacter sp. ANC 4779]TCB51084.1 hypothetical protein E0H80_06875 [Acinetobacter sp. ANC 4779]
MLFKPHPLIALKSDISNNFRKKSAQFQLSLYSILHHTSTPTHQPTNPPTHQPTNTPTHQHTNTEIPQSLNLEFQSGITANNLISASVRWVNGQNFKIISLLISSVSDTPVPLVDYQTDQWTTTLGLAHVFNDKLTSTMDIGLDSVSGNPASTLSPSDGFYSFGIGGFYNIQPNLFIASGIKYLKFNKAKIQQDQNGSGSLFGPLSTVNNNDALLMVSKSVIAFN